MLNKMKKRGLSLYRFVIQVVFFILLPGLYASALFGVKTFVLGVIDGDLNLEANYLAYIEAIAIIPITILLGRFFCGWMCAFGSVTDWLYMISRKVFKVKFQMPEKLDRLLKYFKYVYLVLMGVVFWNVDWDILAQANPWEAFGALFSVKRLPDFSGAIENYLLGTILLVMILVASMVVERFFCRYLCPVGAILALTSPLRIFKIKKDRENCGSCTACTKKCPMGIPLYKKDKVSSGECIQCLRCTEVCPRSNAKLSISGENVNGLIAGTIAVGAITSTYFAASSISVASTPTQNKVAVTAPATAGTTTTDNSTTATATASPTDSASTTGTYKDGTYEGTGTGFHGATTVSVTVESGVISNVEIVSYGDDAPYFERAQSSVISQIIETNSSEVDSVSGATFSSNGIMEAVANALSSAQN